MTSVSGDTFTVFDVFESVTVMLFAVTEEISVSCTGGGVAFFFAFANDGAATPHGVPLPLVQVVEAVAIRILGEQVSLLHLQAKLLEPFVRHRRVHLGGL